MTVIFIWPQDVYDCTQRWLGRLGEWSLRQRVEVILEGLVGVILKYFYGMDTDL